MKNDSSNISPEVIAQLKSYVYDIIGCCQDVHRDKEYYYDVTTKTITAF